MDIKNASLQDARHLAFLLNLAGEGMPEYLWSQLAEEGQTALDVGAARAAREGGGFSYRNARVCRIDDVVAGAVIAYRQPYPYELEPLDQYPHIVCPLILLEAKAPGSWYINGLATYEKFRGRGVARALMVDTETTAIEQGCECASLIVASENKEAKALYEALGYRMVEALPVVEFPGCKHGGDWQLMTKVLA